MAFHRKEGPANKSCSHVRRILATLVHVSDWPDPLSRFTHSREILNADSRTEPVTCPVIFSTRQPPSIPPSAWPTVTAPPFRNNTPLRNEYADAQARHRSALRIDVEVL
ncbi:hypothetical protein SRHO_G00049450 [Serrasalmus rhombeus]